MTVIYVKYFQRDLKIKNLRMLALSQLGRTNVLRVTCYFLLVIRYVLLFSRYSLLFTHCLSLFTLYSLLFIRYLLLLTRYSLLFIGHYLFITHNFLLVIFTKKLFLSCRQLLKVYVLGFSVHNIL